MIKCRVPFYYNVHILCIFRSFPLWLPWLLPPPHTPSSIMRRMVIPPHLHHTALPPTMTLMPLHPTPPPPFTMPPCIMPCTTQLPTTLLPTMNPSLTMMLLHQSAP